MECANSIWDGIKWATPSIREINYIKIPVSALDPNYDIKKINGILDWLHNCAVKGTFIRGTSNSISKHSRNICCNKYELSHGTNRDEILIFNKDYGWTRIQILNYKQEEETNKLEICGSKAFNKLAEKIDFSDDYSYDQELNRRIRKEDTKYYYIDRCSNAFCGVLPDAEQHIGKTLKHVWSLDFHWAFPSALVALKPQTKEVIEELYKQRQKDPIIKAIGVMSIGYMCSEYFSRKNVRGVLSPLRHQILEYHANKMWELVKLIQDQGGKVLLLCTDSIKFFWPYSDRDPVLPYEGSEIGQWSYEFKDCQFRYFSYKKYQYINNDGQHVIKLPGKCTFDWIKPRNEWEWDDMTNPAIDNLLIWKYNDNSNHYEQEVLHAKKTQKTWTSR